MDAEIDDEENGGGSAVVDDGELSGADDRADDGASLEEDDDDDGGDGDGAAEGGVVLGFAEAVDDPEEAACAFNRANFPSKAGGRPAWLDPDAAPTAHELPCPVCQQRLSYLLQVYCPLPPGHKSYGPPQNDSDESSTAAQGDDPKFHRALYVFVCRRRDCGGVAALRCQLPRRNAFYAESYERRDDGGDDDAAAAPRAMMPPAPDTTPLCVLCGLRGRGSCAGCARVRYCSVECQRIDWRLGHGQCCAPSPSSSSRGGDDEGDNDAHGRCRAARRRWRFEERELVMEDDDDGADAAEHAALLARSENPSLQSLPLREMAPSSFHRDDDALTTFLATVAPHPEQVLRYTPPSAAERRVLWAHKGGQWSGRAADCERCGARRGVELQILPQLLYFLGAGAALPSAPAGSSSREDELRRDTLDFGCIVVCTCVRSCSAPPAAGAAPYVREFAHLQPPI